MSARKDYLFWVIKYGLLEHFPKEFNRLELAGEILSELQLRVLKDIYERNTSGMSKTALDTEKEMLKCTLNDQIAYLQEALKDLD